MGVEICDDAHETAGEVDACCARVGAVHPLGLREAEESVVAVHDKCRCLWSWRSRL